MLHYDMLRTLNNEPVDSGRRLTCWFTIRDFGILSTTGNARDAQNLELLRRVGITHIINVTETVPLPFKRSVPFIYLHLPASDTTNQDLRPSFDRAVQFIGKRSSNFCPSTVFATIEAWF